MVKREWGKKLSNLNFMRNLKYGNAFDLEMARIYCHQAARVKGRSRALAMNIKLMFENAIPGWTLANRHKYDPFGLDGQRIPTR
ncbi:Uu.00g065610.m01.CDS01 [Anthostomella pinea]|uniref:Uu.00g065610.m01.CDS01 n=1 Tax=Anthostomella pinea TaxID=933095 RepID=A0AAI8VTS6_9PEZI|nr:Uu.00g065610.m01.CDS01 [Anthostomella pinea]